VGVSVVSAVHLRREELLLSQYVLILLRRATVAILMAQGCQCYRGAPLWGYDLPDLSPCWRCRPCRRWWWVWALCRLSGEINRAWGRICAARPDHALPVCTTLQQ